MNRHSRITYKVRCTEYSQALNYQTQTLSICSDCAKKRRILPSQRQQSTPVRKQTSARLLRNLHMRANEQRPLRNTIRDQKTSQASSSRSWRNSNAKSTRSCRGRTKNEATPPTRGDEAEDAAAVGTEAEPGAEARIEGPPPAPEGETLPHLNPKTELQKKKLPTV